MKRMRQLFIPLCILLLAVPSAVSSMASYHKSKGHDGAQEKLRVLKAQLLQLEIQTLKGQISRTRPGPISPATDEGAIARVEGQLMQRTQELDRLAQAGKIPSIAPGPDISEQMRLLRVQILELEINELDEQIARMKRQVPPAVESAQLAETQREYQRLQSEYLQLTGAGMSARVTAAGVNPQCIHGTLGSGSPDYPGISGAENDRLFRDTVPSTCAGNKVCPGGFAPLPAGYALDAYTFTNSSAQTRCVTVALTTFPGCADGSGLFSVAYLGSFNPANVCTNYRADMGLSTGGPEVDRTETYSFNIPAGATFVVIVNEVIPPLGIGCTYTLTVAERIVIQDNSNNNCLIINNFDCQSGEATYCWKKANGTSVSGTCTVVIRSNGLGQPTTINATATGPTLQVGVDLARGTANARLVQSATNISTIADSNINDSTCTCP